MARLGDRLQRRARETFVGREVELARLLAFASGAEDQTPLALHLHGLPGMGKTALLHALAARLREEAPDVAIVMVDAGEVEPSPAGFCAWLAPAANPADPLKRRRRSAPRVGGSC